MAFVVPPDAKSWVEVAPDSHFPIQNLPFCVFWLTDMRDFHAGVRIGNFLLSEEQLFDAGFARSFSPSHGLMSDLIDGSGDLRALRRGFFELLRSDSPAA